MLTVFAFLCEIDKGKLVGGKRGRLRSFSSVGKLSVVALAAVGLVVLFHTYPRCLSISSTLSNALRVAPVAHRSGERIQANTSTCCHATAIPGPGKKPTGRARKNITNNSSVVFLRGSLALSLSLVLSLSPSVPDPVLAVSFQRTLSFSSFVFSLLIVLFLPPFDSSLFDILPIALSSSTLFFCPLVVVSQLLSVLG
jgi:hypothetical protein